MMKHIIAYLSVLILAFSGACSDMVKKVLDPDLDLNIGDIRDSSAFSIGATISLPGALAGTSLDAKVVDEDDDDEADGLDFNDDGAADVIYLVGSIAKSSNISIALDVNNDGSVDFYLILGRDGIFTMNIASDGTGTSVTVVIDANGDPEGFDTDGGEVNVSITVTYGVPDTTPPTITDSTITTGVIAQNSIELSWFLATDDNTPSINLEYSIYVSSSDNISSVTDAETNGTLEGSSPLTGLTGTTSVFNVTGLTQNTTYYFNIVVSDSKNNKAIYTTVSETTLDSALPNGVWDNTNWNQCLWQN